MEVRSSNTFACLAASNHTDKEREVNDYYATDPKALELLLQKESFSHTVWETCVGGGIWRRF